MWPASSDRSSSCRQRRRLGLYWAEEPGRLKLALELQGFGTRPESAVEDSALRGMQRGGHHALGDNVELGLFVDSGDCVYQFEVQRSVHVAVLWMVESRKPHQP